MKTLDSMILVLPKSSMYIVTIVKHTWYIHNENIRTLHSYATAAVLSRSLKLLCGSLVLGVHVCQFLPDAVVNLHELGDAAINTDGLPLAQVSLVVLGRDAFHVARLGQSAAAERGHLRNYVLAVRDVG